MTFGWLATNASIALYEKRCSGQITVMKIGVISASFASKPNNSFGGNNIIYYIKTNHVKITITDIQIQKT